MNLANRVDPLRQRANLSKPRANPSKPKYQQSEGAFVRIYNLTDNDDVAIVAQQGIFQVMEWKRDFSVTYGSAMDA